MGRWWVKVSRDLAPDSSGPGSERGGEGERQRKCTNAFGEGMGTCVFVGGQVQCRGGERKVLGP